MSADNMPPLPRVDYWWSTRDDATPLFTADQMYAYARAYAAEQTRELREANEAFGKRQGWWTERMFGLEQQRDALLEALVSFTKSAYIRQQHPKRFAAAVAAIKAVEGEKEA